MKKILTTLILIAAAVASQAQLTSSSAFSNAPQKVFPLLDTNTRLDMIDYYNSGMETTSENKLEGRSVITELAPEALTVRMTDSSTAQIVVLQSSKGPIIALINTVATPGLDSNISFYDQSWTPQNAADYFTRPDWKEWLTPEGAPNEDEVMAQTPFMLASYHYDPSTSTLVVTNNLPRFLDKDLYESISSYLYPTLNYVWNGKKFVPAK